jgi:hypothetical protein
MTASRPNPASTSAVKRSMSAPAAATIAATSFASAMLRLSVKKAS